jgi:hypothetical protein
MNTITPSFIMKEVLNNDAIQEIMQATFKISYLHSESMQWCLKQTTGMLIMFLKHMNRLKHNIWTNWNISIGQHPSVVHNGHDCRCITGMIPPWLRKPPNHHFGSLFGSRKSLSTPDGPGAGVSSPDGLDTVPGQPGTGANRPAQPRIPPWLRKHPNHHGVDPVEITLP